jgi:hypothetical protein
MRMVFGSAGATSFAQEQQAARSEMGGAMVRQLSARVQALEAQVAAMRKNQEAIVAYVNRMAAMLSQANGTAARAHQVAARTAQVVQTVVGSVPGGGGRRVMAYDTPPLQTLTAIPEDLSTGPGPELQAPPTVESAEDAEFTYEDDDEDRDDDEDDGP